MIGSYARWNGARDCRMLLLSRWPGKVRVRSPRSNRRTATCPRAPRLEALEDRTLLTVALSSNFWPAIGPAPLSSAQTAGFPPASGRIAALAADPTNANIIYIAAAG